MDINAIVELAKKGSRLVSHEQWMLADELALLTPSEVTQVAAASGRNENTLLQYARAAQRWPAADRVEGVSFSAHRVALSWYDPRKLLVELKQKHGSPTVKQVRQALGLEGHPAIELLWKGIRKIDTNIAVGNLDNIIRELETQRTRLVDEFNKAENAKVTQAVAEAAADLASEPDYEWEFIDENVDDDEPMSPEEYNEALKESGLSGKKEEPEEPTVKRWTPPVSASDVVGL